MKHCNIIISIFFLTFVILFASCNKDASIPTTENIILSSNADNADFKYNEFAKEFALEIVSEINRVSKKSSDSQFLKFIVEKCNLRFDGDPNFLIKDYLYEKIGDKTFIEYFESITQKRLLTAVKFEPKMQIGLHLIEKVDLSNLNIGGVVYLPNDIDIENEPYVNAINGKGLSIQLSSAKAPEIPYIVIGFNERVDENGNLRTKEFLPEIFSNPEFQPTFNPDYSNKVLNCNNQYVDTSTDLEADEIIKVKEYKLLNMKEHWSQFGPEVRMRFLTQSGTKIVTPQHNPSRNRAKNQKWMEVNKTTFTYQPTAHGEQYYVAVWFEEDWGSNETYTFSFNNVTMADGTTVTSNYSTTKQKHDDIYGEALIPIDDPSGTCYQTDNVVFILQFD